MFAPMKLRAAGCLIAGFAAGCGGEQARKRAAEPVPPRVVQGIRAAATLPASHRGGFDLRLVGAQVLGARGAPASGSGDFDFPAATGTASIDLPEHKGTERGTEHIVYQPGQVFVQPRAANAAVIPKGKTWVSATLTGKDSVRTNFPQFTLQIEAINPQLALDELAWGAVRATPLGPQKLDGIATQQFDVTVDLARALVAARGLAAPAFSGAIQSELAALGSRGSSMTIRTWVDDTGVVAKLRVSPPGAGVGTATMSLCCFDQHVRVRVPPAAQVVDVAALTPTGERENNGGGDSDGG
ncbi:MAG: hypothetical protein NVS1B9_03920 [Solirubrobacteraceae bacterium]